MQIFLVWKLKIINRSYTCSLYTDILYQLVICNVLYVAAALTLLIERYCSDIINLPILLLCYIACVYMSCVL